MKTVEISLFGTTFKLKANDTRPARTCGRCKNGLVRTVCWKNGIPYHNVWRCHCQYGEKYSVIACNKGEKLWVKPQYPVYKPGSETVLDHQNWPRVKPPEPEWEF